MLTEEIKKSETYQTFLALSTDVALELGKSMSLTEAEEEEAARRIHATHERLVTASDESDPKPARRTTRSRRPSGIDVMTEEERLAIDIMKAIKASKIISRSQPHTGGSSEELVKGTSKAKAESAIDWGLDNESYYSEEEHVDEEEIEWVSTNDEEEHQDDKDDDDDKSIDLKETNDEDEYVRDDEYVHEDEYVHDDVNEEMKDAEDAATQKDNEEINDVKKTKATKDDQAKGDSAQDNQATAFASTTQRSSSLSVSSGFGNQFLNLYSDTFLDGTVKESANTKINSLLDIQIQKEIPQIQSPSLLKVPVSVISEHNPFIGSSTCHYSLTSTTTNNINPCTTNHHRNSKCYNYNF
ncbi:hypothetical protein Tco_1380871 [Tanacetum coccineum]